MRTIKFRGKKLENNEWVSGHYFYNQSEKHHVIKSEDEGFCDIDDQTLGQFTGLKDKNGKEIYEGDIVHFCIKDYEVRFHEKYSCFTMWELGGNQWYHLSMDVIVEVFGNIYDNPELLEPRI